MVLKDRLIVEYGLQTEKTEVRDYQIVDFRLWELS